MRPPTGTRNDVIDRIGMPTAVLTAMRITHEDRFARQRSASEERDPHDVSEADHRRNGEREVRRADLRIILVNDLCLAGEHQTDGTAGGDHRQRLVRCVEDERALHGQANR